MNNQALYYCSFCGKSQNEVTKLIAGPRVYICNECTLLCMDIVNETLTYKSRNNLVKLSIKTSYSGTYSHITESLGTSMKFTGIG